MKPVVDFHRVVVDERYDGQQKQYAQRQTGLDGLTAPAQYNGPGTQSAKYLKPEITDGDFAAAVSASASLNQIAETGNQFGRPQDFPACDAAAPSSDNPFASRQTADDYTRKAEQTGTQDKTKQPN